MKACYQAIEEGRVEKAADLARQAHGLDPARVEGDPVVYKCHLLRTCARGSGDAEMSVSCRECPAANHHEKAVTVAGDSGQMIEEKPRHTLTISLGFSMDSGLTGNIRVDENDLSMGEGELPEEEESVSFERVGLLDLGRSMVQSMLSGSAKSIDGSKIGLTVGYNFPGRINGSAKVPFQGMVYHLVLRDGLPVLMMTPEIP
ncbi:MAG: hypothetical protein ACKO23_17000 [Gemmataceae bacterium]